MKLRKLLFAASPLVVIAGCTTIPITSCAAKDYTPSIKSAEARFAPYYEIKYDAESKPYYSPTGLENGYEVYHFNGSEIGYMDVDYYVSTFMQFKEIYGDLMFNFTSETSDGKTTIYNPFTRSTCTIDYSKQTLTFSDYDAFLVNQKTSVNPLAVGLDGSGKYFVSAESKYISGGQYVVDLKQYNIKAYYYKNKGYLPYSLYRNILNVMPLKNMFYNGKNFYQINKYENQITCDLYKTIRDTATVFTSEYMEYTYNLLALTLDNKFGLPERQSRVNAGKTISFFPNGAYAELSPYHDKMVSTEPDVSHQAWNQFFKDKVDDGGHAVYAADSVSGVNVLATKPVALGENRGPETKHVYAVKDSLTAARKTAGYDMETFWQEPGTNKKSYYTEYSYDVQNTTQKVAYITFDSFRTDNYNNYTTEEQTAGRELPSSTTAENHHQDAMRLTMYADKMIKQNNIKNLVVDISINGGGVVYTESFIASWLCNGVTQKLYNPHTNSYCEYTAKADINGDGEFTSDDYIGDDVNVYFIISGESFSCGNALPCNVADQRPSTVFIGGQTAGGACYTDTNLETGLGNVFRGSANYHWLRYNSTYDNKISFDSGALPKYYYDALSEPAKYYDRDHINKKILGIE